MTGARNNIITFTTSDTRFRKSSCNNAETPTAPILKK